MFKKLLSTLILSTMFVAGAARADYTLIIPQEPGGGTSVWASIIGKHLEKHLGEPIILQHIPGARDIPAFNKFHNELRNDPKTIMVAHGGNAESFLTEPVDYDYSLYEPIGGMNLSIVTAHRTDFDPYTSGAEIRFSSGSGNNPDMIAFTVMMCGNLDTIDEYMDCFKNNARFVKGMKSSERRLSFVRGELNATRESTAAFIKHVQPLIDKGEAKLWFSHGVMDVATGTIGADPNYEVGTMAQAFEAHWGEPPVGPLYDAYILVKQYRDTLQKSLWMDKGNPNAKKVQAALQAMVNDPEAQAEIVPLAGKYDWMIGAELLTAFENLKALTKEQTLKDLIYWQSEALGVAAVYKDEIVSKD